MKVLVVEDLDVRGEYVRTCLEQEGFEVVVCQNAAQAIPLIAHVDALVTATFLRGMDGAQLADFAKMQRPELPVLITTAATVHVPNTCLADKVIEKSHDLTPMIDWLRSVEKKE